MQSLITRVLFAAILLLSAPAAQAGHLAGIDMTYSFIDSSTGPYHYRLTLTVYQDSLHGDSTANAQDDPAFLGLYTGDGVLISIDSSFYTPSLSGLLPVTTSGVCDVNSIPTVLINKKVFVKDYFLVPRAAGYVITYERCCLNGPVNITNPNNFGISTYVTIPVRGVAANNSGAVFTGYPPLVVGVYAPLSINCTATDADGDSLSYVLSSATASDGNPNNAKPTPGMAPFTALTYAAPLSYSNPVPCYSPMSIDPVSGVLTGTPIVAGLYLVNVSCVEWRNGQVIDTVKREFEITVADCDLAVGSVAKKSLTLTPNPARENITITSPEPISQLTICNTMGKVIDLPGGLTFGKDTIAIDISQLAPGTYFVKINNTDVKMFIKQ